MAEEIGTESRHYVENGSLSDVDAIFGMHIWATLDAGKVNFEDGERMACSDRFTVKSKGKPPTEASRIKAPMPSWLPLR